MAETQMARLIGERRKRLVATILGHAEREIYDSLSPAQQKAFRVKVLAAVDEFADLMRDLLKVTGEDAVVNEHVVELLEQLHSGQQQLLQR